MARIGTDLSEASALLSKGQLVAIPTETVYGLAANALDPAAVLQIFKVKERPAFDPLIVHIKSADAIKDYSFAVPEMAMALATAFWPGPLTLVLPKRDCIPDLVSSGLPTVGLRMPSHPLTLSLLQQLPFPLAAPSANPFGYISPTTAQHVFDQLREKIPYILDGGPCTVGVESTIVGFEEKGVVVYRLGGLTIEEIRKIAPKVKLQVHNSSDPKAPGMLLSHYAPGKPFYLGEINELIKSHRGKKLAVLSFRDSYTNHPDVFASEILTSSGDLNEAASNLFSAMRRLDVLNVDVIVAEQVPEMGLGLAINDRLRRAAS